MNCYLLLTIVSGCVQNGSTIISRWVISTLCWLNQAILDSMTDEHLRRWPNLEPTLTQAACWRCKLTISLFARNNLGKDVLNDRRRRSNSGLRLVQRLRRWTNLKPEFDRPGGCWPAGSAVALAIFVRQCVHTLNLVTGLRDTCTQFAICPFRVLPCQPECCALISLALSLSDYMYVFCRDVNVYIIGHYYYGSILLYLCLNVISVLHLEQF